MGERCGIISLVNAQGLQLVRAMVSHVALLVPALLYGSGSRIWTVQMENLRGLLGIRRMDKARYEVFKRGPGMSVISEIKKRNKKERV